MKLSYLSIISASLLLASCQQEDATIYEIGTWNGFRTAAVSLTFDDNCPNQFDIAVPILDDFDVKATFYPIVNTITDWSTLRKCAANGHEIGSHTYTHANLGSIPADDVEKELTSAYDTIRTRVPMTDCSSFAYPYCAMPDQAIIERHHIAARICDNKIVPQSPTNYMAISSFIAGTESNIHEAIDLIGVFSKALVQNGWAVILFHEIDEGSGYSPFPSEELQKTLEYLTENDTCYWVATFTNVAKYTKERDNAKIKVISENSDKITINVSTTLNATLYNVPITIRRPLPTDWQNADITQDGTDCQAYIIDNMLYFDIVPNGTNIEITKR